MSAQPLNTDISIYRVVRSYRNAVRQETVAALIKRLRPLVMMIPGQEIAVEVKSRDTTVADFSPFMGQASHAFGRGFPIVIGLRSQVTFATAETGIASVDFPFQIGQDKFITNTLAGLTTDLFKNLQALNPLPAAAEE